MDNNEETQNTQEQQSQQLPKKGGFSIKTLLLIIVLILITVSLVALAIMQKPPVKEVQPQAQITPNPIQTTLTISSTPTPQATPSAYKADIVINTGQNAVTSVQLELIFDPKVLTDVNIEPGPFFVNPVVNLKTIDTINGRITFAVSDQFEPGPLGQGILAKISFTTLKKNVSTAIDFLPKTQVNAKGMSESVLKTSVGALFNFTVTPTITASPSATPSGR